MIKLLSKGILFSLLLMSLCLSVAPKAMHDNAQPKEMAVVGDEFWWLEMMEYYWQMGWELNTVDPKVVEQQIRDYQIV